jgi:Annexin
MILLTTDPAERDAKLVHEALKKKGEKAIWVIIEVSCASTPDHLIDVRRVYRTLFFSSLEEEIASSSLHKENLRGVCMNSLQNPKKKCTVFEWHPIKIVINMNHMVL